MPGTFVHPLRSGFSPGGFRNRLGTGVLAGPMLGPGRFGFPRGGGRFFGVPNGFIPNGFVPNGFIPNGFVPNGFIPNGFGFFGFPTGRFGFFFDGFSFFGGFPIFGAFPTFGGFPFRNGFFFDGFPFVDGFPLFNGFPFFDGFPFVDGFPVLHRFPLAGGFAHRRFGFFGPPALPFGLAPFGFVPPPSFGFGGSAAFPYAPLYSAGYTATSPTAQPTPTRLPDTSPALGRQFAVPGFVPGAGDSLVVERVSVMDVVPATVLRLTWRNAGLEAAQVALFLADSAQGVLASQTLRAPPFTALLEPPPGTAYAGVTVQWPDGTTTSRLVPYRGRPR